MSYMAKCSGTIVLKDGVDANEIDKSLEGLFDDTYPNGKNIEVYAYMDNYQEEQYYTLYEKISPFVKEANIEFVGEDNSFWKHECKNGIWNELSGKIVYNNHNPMHIAGINNDKKEDEIDDIER